MAGPDRRLVPAFASAGAVGRGTIDVATRITLGVQGVQMAGDDLTSEERAELARLRAEAAASRGRWARGGRWVGACALLLVGALLGGLGVVAVYLRSQVLDTDTYVETVAPLASDPVVQNALAHRLADEIVIRTDLEGLAGDAAGKLTDLGVPEAVTGLVGPVVSGINSLLYDRIKALLATPQFEAAWVNINRVAHNALVDVLTKQQSDLVTTTDTTISIDLGELLTLAKQRLAAEGLTFVSQVPDVSIPYTVVESDQLPKIRTYTSLLDAAGTWLPYVALALILLGIVVAPNWRRGIITGAAMLAVVAGLLLVALQVVRTYYLDNLPPTVASSGAATTVYDTLLRFLYQSLRTLLVALGIFIVGALLAGPSRVAVAIRRLLNLGLDAGGRALAHTGHWAVATGRVLSAARQPLQIGIVVIAVVIFILATRPDVAAVLWAAFGVLLTLALLEVFSRAGLPTRTPTATPSPGGA